MNRSISYGFAALLGIAGSAPAAVQLQWINRGSPTQGAPTATGFTGWVARLTSDSGSINGVDLESGDRGIHLPMIQRWTDPESPDGSGDYSVRSPLGTHQNLTSSVNNFDSHFLPPLNNPANMLVAVMLNEDNLISGDLPPFPSNTLNAAFGQGSFLEGAYGVAGASQSTSLDVAYLVLPNNVPPPSWPIGLTLPNAGFKAAVATAGGTFTIHYMIIPEPSTLLAAWAGAPAAVLLGRRWRRMPSETSDCT